VDEPALAHERAYDPLPGPGREQGQISEEPGSTYNLEQVLLHGPGSEGDEVIIYAHKDKVLLGLELQFGKVDDQAHILGDEAHSVSVGETLQLGGGPVKPDFQELMEVRSFLVHHGLHLFGDLHEQPWSQT